MTDRNGRATFISQGWINHTGKSIDKTLGLGWLEDIHPHDRGKVEAFVCAAPEKQKTVEFSFRLKHFLGEYPQIAACASPGFSETGEFTGWAVWAEAENGRDPANPIFELISNNMREIVCLLSKDAQILYISPAVEAILGYQPEELIGQVFPPRIVPTNLQAGYKDLYAALSQAEGAQFIEICLPSRAGDLVWLELDLQFLRDESGGLKNLQVVARDISQRKQNQQILQLQNEVSAILWETANLNASLQEVLEILTRLEGIDSGGIYITDLNSNDLDLVCHKGLTKEYIDAVRHYPSSHSLVELCRKGDPIYADFPALLARMRPEPITAYSGEGLRGFAAFPVVHQQRLIAVFNLASHIQPEIPDFSRKTLEFLTRHIGTLIARNQIETALRESEEKFRTFFEQSTDIMSLVDEKGMIVEWNPASENLTGLKISEAVGRPSVDVQFDLLPPDKKSAAMYRKMQDRYASAQRDGKGSFLNRILEGQIVDKIGKRHFFQQVVFPIRTAKGVMLGSTGRDVTGLKMVEEAEREHRKLTEALIVSASVLNGSLHLENIYQHIPPLTTNIVSNDGGALLLYDGETGKMGIAWSSGNKENLFSSLAAGHPFKLDEFPVLLQIHGCGEALIIGEMDESRFFASQRGQSQMRSYLGVPVCIKQRVIGFLSLFSAEPNHFEEKHAQWLQAFANQAALAIENARLFATVEQLAVQDELTHVYNRRGLIEVGEREVERARRFNHPLAVLFLDVDHFKEINDAHSHAAGDRVLQAVASCFGELLRSVDVIGRYGGEEFVFLLPETNMDNARAIAERLRAKIEKIRISTSSGDLKVTVSIGVAALSDDMQTLDELLNKADAAVHRAKAGGRNRVETG
jgi:diguanylate cyclase (GGDEF)-like protein/PAS domain S-box-containing protein